MNLTTVHQSLQIVLGEAKTTTDCDITASWAEWTVGTMLLRSTSLVSAGTSAVTVVAAPPNAATWEQVKEIRLHNNDTVTHKVTLQLDAGGTPYIVLQSSVAAGGDFVYTPDAGAAAGASGTVTDVVAGAGLNVGAGPGGSITNAGTLNVKPATTAAIGGVVIGSGITVNSGGTISSSGGGGGSYTAGLGLYLTSGTFGNTGTIVQPAATGTHSGLGIILTGGQGGGGYPSFGGNLVQKSGPNTGTGTDGFVYSGYAKFEAGIATATDTVAGRAAGGYMSFSNAAVNIGTLQAASSQVSLGDSYADASTGIITNGDMNIGSGGITGGGLGSRPANINFSAGSDYSNIVPGANISLNPGTGSANGLLLVTNIGTVDPHVLNAKWQTSIAGVGYVGVYSKG